MKQTSQQSKHVAGLLKDGRTRAQRKRKGNTAARTARSGSGRKIR